MGEIKLNVDGMMCQGCENRVINALSTIDGVQEVIANHEDGTVIVKTNSLIEGSLIKEKIEDLGFEVKEN